MTQTDAQRIPSPANTTDLDLRIGETKQRLRSWLHQRGILDQQENCLMLQRDSAVLTLDR